MKRFFSLLAWLLLASIACSANVQPVTTFPTETPSPAPSIRAETTPTMPVTQTEVPSGGELLVGGWQRCVASNGLWLRSKPWAEAKPVIANALLAGTVVEIFYSPQGYDGFVEVWVPSEGVTGYVNIKYVGECK